MTPEEQWLRDLGHRKAAYTRQTVADYRAAAAAAGLTALVVALDRAVRDHDGDVSEAWLRKLPQWRALVAAVSGVLVAQSVTAEARVPSLVAAAREDADAYLGKVAPGEVTQTSGNNAVHVTALAAAGFLLARRDTVPVRVEKLLVARAFPVVGRHRADVPKITIVAALKDLVAQRVAAEAAHTLHVLNTETANVGRAMVADVIGPDGDWVWVTREDGLVCPVCAENHGQLFPASVMFEEFHPSCRCLAVPAR